MTFSKLASYLAAAVCMATTLGTPALAHDEATLDAMPSAHGGQLRMAGIYHFELVVAPAAVAGQGVPVHVYVTDHLGQKIATAQASGSASFVNGKARTQVALAPEGDNGLTGVLPQLPKRGTQALVSIAPVPGQAPVQAKFTRLQAKLLAAAAHPLPDAQATHDMPADHAHQH